MSEAVKWLKHPVLWLGAVFLVFQYWILFNPQQPLIERPAHLVFALALVFLAVPGRSARFPALPGRVIDILLVAATAAVGYYYYSQMPRLQTRIENVSPILWQDIAVASTLVLLLLEGVRRTVGIVLVIVIGAFLLYAFFGNLLPGALGHRGMTVSTLSELLVMTTSGIMGVTTETSVNFIFYFIVFGAVYSAVGGGQLFIDLSMKLVGKARGGGAKVAIVGSSLMGTVSGSAVANVAATGVFTIPMMRKTGLTAERAAATEAIASTGGQLSPPVMGIAAFVMAELIVMPYTQIALAGLIPAVAFYVALFISADLHARKHNAGTLTDGDFVGMLPILPRLHLIAPPVILVLYLMAGYSAPTAAVYATAFTLFLPLLRKQTRYGISAVPAIIVDAAKQAASIAVPIASVGIIIVIAIQSNMALKFSSGLISIGGTSYAFSLVLVIIGCIVMGMGLPTVAAYIIGAILYAPALVTFGLEPIQAHFFVMYYCVLSMITPPVALASFAAAGIARTGPMKTSMIALQMSGVAFLIPFAFVADQALLFRGEYIDIAVACAGLLASSAMWAAGLSGYIVRRMHIVEQSALLLAGATAMVTQTGSLFWLCGIAAGSGIVLLNFVSAPRIAEQRTGTPAP